MEPATIAILITSLVTLAVNVFQSVKMSHFKSSCFQCCELTHDMENQKLNSSGQKS